MTQKDPSKIDISREELDRLIKKAAENDYAERAREKARQIELGARYFLRGREIEPKKD